jgi:uncharacterized membrane protein
MALNLLHKSVADFQNLVTNTLKICVQPINVKIDITHGPTKFQNLPKNYECKKLTFSFFLKTW